MTNLWKNLLVGGFLIAFIVLLGFFNATKPRILVLHSAGAESSWAREMDRGMREALDRNRRPLAVEWNYLGTDSPAARNRTGEALAQAQRAMARFNPDVLIAVDDQANSLLARDYAGRARPRILYVSMNRPPADFGYAGATNVSGISEQMPLAAIRDAVVAMFPGRNPRVHVLGVDGETGRAEMDEAKAFDWAPLQLGETALVTRAAGWHDFVKRTGAEDILLLLGTKDLPDEYGAMTAGEINRWTEENATALPIGTEVDFVADGGGLSFSPPPDDYGEKAIELALDWLDDRDTPGAPPPVVSDHFEVAVRQSRMADRGVALPPIYIEAARENGTLHR